MTEKHLKKILSGEISAEDVCLWLKTRQHQQHDSLALKLDCSKSEFVAFFLNYIHEETRSSPLHVNKTSCNSSLNGTHNSIDNSVDLPSRSSTPKQQRSFNDSSSLNQSISPISKSKSNSSLCLGDFITGHSIKNKRATTVQRRIKPTSLNYSLAVGNNSSNYNSFNFSDLRDEKVTVDIDSVTHNKELDNIVTIYSYLLSSNLVVNLTSEVHFLLSLLHPPTVKTRHDFFDTCHNLVYFACRCLWNVATLLKSLDRATLQLLAANHSLTKFSPDLVSELSHELALSCAKIEETKHCSTNTSICFNSDTDNRSNFPSDASFNAFRKQRDLFYEILRIWERFHLSPDFNFATSLGGKIRTLLSLYNDSTNYIHLTRLFKNQLITNSHGCPNNSLLNVDIDRDKFNKLTTRCTTKRSGGLNSTLTFNEWENFYRDFIVTCNSYSFVKHLQDALIDDLSSGSLNFDDDVDQVITGGRLFRDLKTMKVSAKFLGLIESLPYSTNQKIDHLLSDHVAIRQSQQPNFDVSRLLAMATDKRSSLLLTVTIAWIVDYLSMLDHVTLRLPYYKHLISRLYSIYRANDLIVPKLCLGWLFELPHFPSDDYFSQYFSTPICEDQKSVSVPVNVDKDILYYCCPYLDELRTLLVDNTSNLSSSNSSVIKKHITPVSDSAGGSRKKIEAQLEDSFFVGQPSSVKKTVDFVSERVASACVKHICSQVVPDFKRQARKRFRGSLEGAENCHLHENVTSLKTLADQFATHSLRDLHHLCKTEIESISADKITSSLDSLLAFDTLPQTHLVCIEITRRSCTERVKNWMDSHLTIGNGIFTRDFEEEIVDFVKSPDLSTGRRPVFTLPSGGDSARPNDDEATSGAHLLEKITDTCVILLECDGSAKISGDYIMHLLNDIKQTVNSRGDINECIVASICTLLVDLCLLLINCSTILDEDLLMNLSQIFLLYHNGPNDLFTSILSARNVKIFDSVSPIEPTDRWKALAFFCSFLLRNDLMTGDNFEGQCMGFFRHDWDQQTLKHVTTFFRKFLELSRNDGHFGFLLEFLSEYCEDL